MSSILSSLVVCLAFCSNPSTIVQPVTATNNIAATIFSAQPEQGTNSKFQDLCRNAPKLNKNVLSFALKAYTKARDQGDVKKSVLTVIDYSLPSNEPRMWIFDMQDNKLLFKTYVAHGKNSGDTKAYRFSNTINSKETSLGTFITQNTYMGHNGYSLNLEGMDPGFNTNALTRRVVVHGAWYVDPSFIKKEGRAGKSWGCPAISEALAKPVINTIKDGSVLFAYYPDSNFLNTSKFLKA